MPYANNLTAYPDVRQLFDKALDTEKGLKLTFATYSEAQTASGRFNAFRVRDRKENQKIYPADHALHGASVYDGLQVLVRENVVIIKKLDISQFNVEEI